MTNQSTSSSELNHNNWVQLNVGLVRHQGQALPSAIALFARLAPIVNQWRNNGSLRWFFFMRKPPDVRLRFWISLDQQRLISELSELMRGLQEENFIHLYFFSNYTPETERFGGFAAMEWVHNYFDIDTSLWLMLNHLYLNNLNIVPPEILLSTILNDLFECTLLDQVSVIAVWQNLASLISLTPTTTIPSFKILSITDMCESGAINPAEIEILQQYAIANQIMAQELVNLQNIGQLTQPLTDILAALAMFNFHRHGFQGSYSSGLIAAILGKAH